MGICTFQVVVIFNFIYFTPLSYGNYELPGWAQALGWMMAALSVVMVIVIAVIKVARTYRSPDWTDESLIQVSDQSPFTTSQHFYAQQGICTTHNYNRKEIWRANHLYEHYKIYSQELHWIHLFLP